MTRLEEAAQRVRVARTMHAARQDDESAEELAMALEAFQQVASQLQEDGARKFGVDPKNPDFKEPS